MDAFIIKRCFLVPKCDCSVVNESPSGFGSCIFVLKSNSTYSSEDLWMCLLELIKRVAQVFADWKVGLFLSQFAHASVLATRCKKG